VEEACPRDSFVQAILDWGTEMAFINHPWETAYRFRAGRKNKTPDRRRRMVPSKGWEILQ